MHNKESRSLPLFWQSRDIYKTWSNRTGADFIIYDGPPYANGNIHIGHAVNKILKDTINRFKALQGYNIKFMLGWDCHGLPIEAQVESEFKKTGKKNITPQELIDACKAFANKYISIQQNSFEKLGIIADKKYYTLMDKEHELMVISFIHHLARENLLIRKLRPVFWSCEERTALADAEIEYKLKKSKAIDLLVKIEFTDLVELKDCCLVIWTTTPWTLPSNRAIAYGEEFTYLIIQTQNHKLVICEELVESFLKRSGMQNLGILGRFKGNQLQNTTYKHPLDNSRPPQPLLNSAHVTKDQGTGFVHISPDHGLDDFYLCQKHKIECCNYLNDNGYFTRMPQEMSVLSDKFYSNASEEIIVILSDNVLSIAEITHSYPHSWRSGKPIILRATEQWFIEIEKTDKNLKEGVLSMAENIQWYPEYSKNRFISTVTSRESWCISRQRIWGVPLCFLHKDGKIAIELLDRCFEYVKANGIYSWHNQNIDLGIDINDFDKATDICDVWIESGLAPQYIQKLLNIKCADVVIEGSDQHRAWFQSQLYCSLITNGITASTKIIATHGFVVDDEGKKMSKSKANGLSPEAILEDFGLDCLRLWVLTKDYTQELRIAKNHLTVLQKVEQKIKNTIKFLLQNCKRHNNISYKDYSPLDQWILHVTTQIQKDMSDYTKTITSFSLLFRDVHNFCEHSLSKIYFDAIKDNLYFEKPTSIKRQATESALYQVANALLHWIAPFMPVASEEAWQIFSGNMWKGGSIHSNIYPEAKWENIAVAEKVEQMLKYRSEINQEIEKIRSNSEEIKNAKDCSIAIAGQIEYPNLLKQICGVSELILEESEHFAIKSIKKSPWDKCEKCRCRKHDLINGLCERCTIAKLEEN